MSFYVFAVPYRLLGQTAQAMQLSAVLTNLVVVSATLWLLARRGRAALAAGALCVVGTVWALPPGSIADSWNATIPILAVVLTMAACWSVLMGDQPATIVAVIAYVFVFQTHIGFGVALAPVVVVTAIVTQRSLGSGTSTWLDRSLVVGGVLCVPMLIDTVVDWPGNLRRLIRWSVSNDVDALGLQRAASIIGRQTSLSFFAEPWLPTFLATVVDPLPPSVAPGTLLVLLIVAIVVSVHRRLRPELVLIVLLLSVWISSFFVIASVRGPAYEWLFGWLVPLAWMTVAALALVAWRVATATVRVRVGAAPR